MKKLLSFIPFLLLANICISQSLTLYNKGGVKFSYTERITSTFNCAEDNTDYQLIEIRYSISNNSGKLAYVEFNIDVTGLDGIQVSCAFKANTNLAQSPYTLTAASTDKINNGGEEHGTIGGWIKSGATPRWSFYTRTYDPPVPKQKVEPAATKKNNKSDNELTYLYQDDLRINPTGDYDLQKLKDQQARDSLAAQHVLNAEKQQREQQAQRQKKIADDNKRRQDEYDKQQEAFRQQKQDALSTLQKETNEKLGAIRNNGAALNNAIQTTGYAIWDIIQSCKAKKMETGEAILTSFAQDIYSTKRNDPYYNDLVCSVCNGTGSVEHDVPSTNVLYGQSYRCLECNGIGRLKKLKRQYDLFAFSSDDQNGIDNYINTNSQEMKDFGQYFQKAISGKQPLFRLYPSGYKGSVDIRVRVKLSGYHDDLFLKISQSFDFLTKNGKMDYNAPIAYTTLNDKKMFALKTIQGFVFVKGDVRTNEGSTLQSYDHILLACSNGETIEFTTGEEPISVVEKLNELLYKVKNRSNEGEKKLTDEGNNSSGKEKNLSAVNLRDDAAGKEKVNSANSNELFKQNSLANAEADYLKEDYLMCISHLNNEIENLGKPTEKILYLQLKAYEKLIYSIYHLKEEELVGLISDSILISNKFKYFLDSLDNKNYPKEKISEIATAQLKFKYLGCKNWRRRLIELRTFSYVQQINNKIRLIDQEKGEILDFVNKLIIVNRDTLNLFTNFSDFYFTPIGQITSKTKLEKIKIEKGPVLFTCMNSEEDLLLAKNIFVDLGLKKIIVSDFLEYSDLFAKSESAIGLTFNTNKNTIGYSKIKPL